MPVKSRHFAYIKTGENHRPTRSRGVKTMKRRMGKAGIALIFGARSAIFGVVIGQAIKNEPLDITKLRRDDGHTEDNR